MVVGFFMRFQKYINEKYLNTVHQKFMNIDAEVFINPSRKELRELIDDTGGYRFILDFKNKNMYAFTMDMFHETFFKREDFWMTWNQFWTNGKNIDKVFTGAVDGINNRVESDMMIRFGMESYKYKKELQKLLDQNWSWVKHIDIDKAKKLIQDVVDKEVNMPTGWGK